MRIKELKEKIKNGNDLNTIDVVFPDGTRYDIDDVGVTHIYGDENYFEIRISKPYYKPSLFVKIDMWIWSLFHKGEYEWN